MRGACGGGGRNLFNLALLSQVAVHKNLKSHNKQFSLDLTSERYRMESCPPTSINDNDLVATRRILSFLQMTTKLAMSFIRMS